jgi:hypothetical protein
MVPALFSSWPGRNAASGSDHLQGETMAGVQLGDLVEQCLPLAAALLAGERPADQGEVVAEAQLARALLPLSRTLLGDDQGLPRGQRLPSHSPRRTQASFT